MNNTIALTQVQELLTQYGKTRLGLHDKGLPVWKFSKWFLNTLSHGRLPFLSNTG